MELFQLNHGTNPLASRTGFLRHGKWVSLLLIFPSVLLLCGCTSLSEWLANGLKVGPNYAPPGAKVADQWIDADNQRVRSEPADYRGWWNTFNDPVLNELIEVAYYQNLDLRAAVQRVLEARAQRAIAAGQLFPQEQQAFGGYAQKEISSSFRNNGLFPQRFFADWDMGFNLAWELDVWGRLRRNLESANARLDGSIEDYGVVLVTLLSDVATAYVKIRTAQKQLALTQVNAEEQKKLLAIVKDRKEAESPLNYYQLKSNLENTLSLIPGYEIEIRHANNQLCILLGMPPENLLPILGKGPIPKSAPDVVVGMPAELLLRRPDVRAAERALAAQSAQIGVAIAEFYPQIGITGIIGLEANYFPQLFSTKSWFGQAGPSFRWNILNYGRILNHVRFQDVKLGELAFAYQQTVLKANEELENALVAFLKDQEKVRTLWASADSVAEATKILETQQKEGAKISYNRMFILQRFKVRQMNLAVQAEGDLATSLIRVYRALGGGWPIGPGPFLSNEGPNGCRIATPLSADTGLENGSRSPKAILQAPVISPGPVMLPDTVEKLGN